MNALLHSLTLVAALAVAAAVFLNAGAALR